MTVNDKLLIEISDLIIRTMDHSVTDEEFTRFQSLLKTNPAAREYYFDIISTFAGVEEIRTFLDENQNDASQLLKALSDEERTSPKITILKPEPKKEPLLRKSQTPKFQYIYFEKRYFTQLLLSAAAILLVVFMVKFIPNRSDNQVATLSKSLDAEWAEMPYVIEDGVRLTGGADDLQLRKGVAELLFDNGVNVVIEAPAEFMILGKDRIKLFYGQLYADVPHQAIGFSVNTLNSQIIDLGTAFGVKAEADGASQVHVLKGTVNLVAGSRDEKYTGRVHQGQAKRVSGFSSQVTDISCNETLFIRDISPETNIIWRGEKTMDLADIASGGNGFGTALPDRGIDLKTGELVSGNSERRGKDSEGYIPVEGLDFVDGVFVPNAADGPVQLTSQGDTYDAFGSANKQYYMAVGKYSSVNMFSSAKKEWYYNKPLMLQGYSAENSTTLCLHANAGITFDLQDIRKAMPYLKLDRFASVYGMSEQKDETNPPMSDFYVFVDGKLRWVRKDVSVTDKPQTVSIELREGDRFLTLVCTEGVSNHGDWSLFVNPRLEITAAD